MPVLPQPSKVHESWEPSVCVWDRPNFAIDILPHHTSGYVCNCAFIAFQFIRPCHHEVVDMVYFPWLSCWPFRYRYTIYLTVCLIFVNISLWPIFIKRRCCQSRKVYLSSLGRCVATAMFLIVSALYANSTLNTNYSMEFSNDLRQVSLCEKQGA